MNHCSDCGTKLKHVGQKPWQEFYECENGHKYEYIHGDGQGGSSSQFYQAIAFPKDMEPPFKLDSDKKDGTK